MKPLLAGLCVIIVIGFAVKFMLAEYPCAPPEKPAVVPPAAVWKGGCDGGSWIEMVSLGADGIKLRTYRDWDGKLFFESEFIYEDCGRFRLTEDSWAQCIGDLVNGVIDIENRCSEAVGCRLEPI